MSLVSDLMIYKIFNCLIRIKKVAEMIVLYPETFIKLRGKLYFPHNKFISSRVCRVNVCRSSLVLVQSSPWRLDEGVSSPLHR